MFIDYDLCIETLKISTTNFALTQIGFKFYFCKKKMKNRKKQNRRIQEIELRLL